jgi:hypothetical protein
MQLNVSNILERALKEKLGSIAVDLIVSDKCDFCGRKGNIATKEVDGLIWMWPDEQWMCPRCWKTASEKVKHGKNY